jgi:hypothetical protein
MKNISQNSQGLDRDKNLALLEYKLKALRLSELIRRN